MAVYLVDTEVDPGHEAEWIRWQEEEHIPALLGLPGYLGVQRLRRSGVACSYLNIWWLESTAAFGTPAYARASLTSWFERIRPWYSVGVRFAIEDPAGPITQPASELTIEGGWAQTGGEQELASYRDRLLDRDEVSATSVLWPVPAGQAASDRSIQSSLLLVYWAAGVSSPVTGAPANLEVRRFLPIEPYRTAGARQRVTG